MSQIPNLPINTNDPVAVVVFLLFIGLGFAFLIWLADTIIDYMRFRKLTKNPEYMKAIAEREAKLAKLKQLPPNLVPKKVKVLVLREDQILEDLCKTDGEVVRCKNLKMMFTIPADYRPYLTYVQGKKITATMIFDENNNAIRIKFNNDNAEAEKVKIDPRFQESIIGRRIFEQVFRRFAGMDMGSFIAGLGLGAFALALIVFFILPILGYPVVIGKVPVEVHLNYPHPVESSLPPPGNFTINSTVVR